MDNLLCYEKEEVSKNNYECFYVGENYYKKPNIKLYTEKDGMYSLHENNHIQFKYQILSNIGKGQYGRVAKVFDHSNKQNMAIKVFRKNSRRFKIYTRNN